MVASEPGAAQGIALTDTRQDTAQLTEQAQHWLWSSGQALALVVEKSIIISSNSARGNQVSSESSSMRRPSENSPIRLLCVGNGNLQTPSITISDVKREEESSRLCGLLSCAVGSNSPGNVHDVTTFFLTWEIDGREAGEDHQHISLPYEVGSNRRETDNHSVRINMSWELQSSNNS